MLSHTNSIPSNVLCLVFAKVNFFSYAASSWNSLLFVVPLELEQTGNKLEQTLSLNLHADDLHGWMFVVIELDE